MNEQRAINDVLQQQSNDQHLLIDEQQRQIDEQQRQIHGQQRQIDGQQRQIDRLLLENKSLLNDVSELRQMTTKHIQQASVEKRGINF